jgi:endonuclease III
MKSAAARAPHSRLTAPTAVGAGSVKPVMEALALAITGLDLPAVEKISESQEDDPFQVLIATLLSARTQDATTLAASTRLFQKARTARTMAALKVKEIERLIYPVSFYRHKARHVKAACQMVVERFGGRVPGTMEDLLTLPGVGRKTANLVLILSFKSQRNICVDTHVHRISNRLGWVVTRTPEETEQALYAMTATTDQHWWPYINLYLVTWGQNVCRPVYPRCGECVLRPLCPQVGVARTARVKGGASRAISGGPSPTEEQ